MLKSGRATILAIAAILLPASAAAASGVKLNGVYTGTFPDGIGSVTLTFAGGNLKDFVAPDVKLKNTTCDGHNDNSFNGKGTKQGGPGKPTFTTAENPYLHSWGASAEWYEKNQGKSAGVNLGWSPPKSKQDVKMQLFIQWNYQGPDGYTDICQSTHPTETVKLK